METLHLCFHIPCPSLVVAALMTILFFGILITGTLILAANRFITTKDGTKFPLEGLLLTPGYDEVQKKLGQLPDKSKTTAILALKYDFYFMPCLYLFMFFLALSLRWHIQLCECLCCFTAILMILPFINWFFDIGENIFGIMVLKKASPGPAKAMFFCSLLKWVTGGIYTLGIIILALMHFVCRCC